MLYVNYVEKNVYYFLCGKVNSLAIIFQIKTINKQNIRRLSTIYSQNVDKLCQQNKIKIFIIVDKFFIKPLICLTFIYIKNIIL